MAQEEEVLLLAMCDDTTVPLLRSVVETHFANGVFPRLLGFDTEDGLTTTYPSRDEYGRFTILRQLGVSKGDFLHLLQFTRTGHLDKFELEGARRAALLLGGLPALDAYTLPYNPVTPEDDVHHTYEWMVTLDAQIRSFVREHPEWEVAGPARQFYYYLRKVR